MNNYITFDSKKYHTSSKSWKTTPMPMATSRILADGSLDIVHGPATIVMFTGEIAADISPESGYGSYSDLITSLKKKQAFSFTDHYGTSYTVHAIGPFIPRSISPKWDSPSNTIYVSVQLRGKEA